MPHDLCEREVAGGPGMHLIAIWDCTKEIALEVVDDLVGYGAEYDSAIGIAEQIVRSVVGPMDEYKFSFRKMIEMPNGEKIWHHEIIENEVLPKEYRGYKPAQRYLVENDLGILTVDFKWGRAWKYIMEEDALVDTKWLIEYCTDDSDATGGQSETKKTDKKSKVERDVISHLPRKFRNNKRKAVR